MNTEQTSENIFMHALILVPVHSNILDNINLADVGNEFVDRKDNRISELFII